jgi:hypothetical protein
VPTTTDNGMIRLGDVLVSKPAGEHSGVVQYDHGRAEAATLGAQVRWPHRRVYTSVRPKILEAQWARSPTTRLYRI